MSTARARRRLQLLAIGAVQLAWAATASAGGGGSGGGVRTVSVPGTAVLVGLQLCATLYLALRARR